MAFGDFVRNGGVAGVQTAGSTLTLNVPAAGHAAGNIVVVSSNSVDALSSVTDSKGNTYSSPIGINNGTSSRCYIAWAQLTAALVSGDTITLTFAASNSSRCGVSEEYDGAGLTASLDKSATATGSSGTVSTGTTAAQSGTNDLAVAAFGIDGAATEYSGAPGNSYTARQSQDIGTNTKAVRSASITLSGSGATSSTQTCSFTENWAGVVVTIQATGNPPGYAPRRPLLPRLHIFGTLRQPRLGFSSSFVAPVISDVFEAVLPGGAVASGFGPVAVVPVPQGGAVADGRSPSVAASVTIGGASAGGFGPVAVASLTIGGASTGGFAATARVSLTIGGATAGGFSPTDGISGGDNVPQGGAIAGGRAPAPSASETIGGAAGDGRSPSAVVTSTRGGAAAAGQTQAAGVPCPIGGAGSGGFTGTVRVAMFIGGSTAGGFSPLEPAPAVPLPPFYSRNTSAIAGPATGRTRSRSGQPEVTTAVRGRMGRR